MKNFTFLIACLVASSGYMNAQSYSDLVPIHSSGLTNSSTNSAVFSGEAITNLITYDNRTDFQNDYDGSTILEEFLGGPGAGQIQNCGLEISSNGDGCFAPGELEEGFTVTSRDGEDMIFIGNGAIGNSISLVGANAFEDVTFLNFTPNGVYAVGFDLLVSDESIANLEFFDTNGDLLEIFTVNVTPNVESFVGFISDVAIGRIEIEGSNEAGELFGGLEFGTDSLMGVSDADFSSFKYYPNPTTGMMSISSDKNIEAVSIFNMLGQKVFESKVNAISSQFDMSRFAAGNYIMKVTIDGITKTHKIIKK